jgi:hypothetical protein
MKIEIYDCRGKTELDNEDLVGIIKNQLDYLVFLSKDGRVPTQHLLKDIAVYEFILRQENALELTKDYFKKKREFKDWTVVKNYEVADILGWKYL